MIQTLNLPLANFEEIARELVETGKQVKVLWQEEESLAFVAKGRDYRSEFHINPSSELMYQISGAMDLYIRTPEGEEEVIVLKEGSAIYTPPGVPHSPRFPSSAFLLVVERMRRPGEVDRFQWFCPKCDNLLHEEQFVVEDYRLDPVSQAYRNFYTSEDARTCKRCGEVMPKPEGW
ncbi:MAG TPA: cupin domain-containing protein [Chloroflexota bacterium]|jgi:3-hydroxyanthranilate 3,4-dioxygenase|nr:cupin domain-containing protein [Chloroflexota bacterium]